MECLEFGESQESQRLRIAGIKALLILFFKKLLILSHSIDYDPNYHLRRFNFRTMLLENTD